MIFVEEMSIEAETMKFIIWVSIIKFSEKFKFFESSLVPWKKNNNTIINN